ncbi:nucleoside-diphosphate-sugar epimerase, putative [Talaromyces stipitatus ATCC 10500]|uniref:Nucleoside-diphosphate-sugar epimerase, putative n=1 Tax=Talaromyces stipitatus (strain ATCC 10500 / CBS 375.48 / QM 6759 / NRRL 1006) TaxID=441959 RepID=B8MRE5_TALSN|nr:nucleoside-diphosphate-sugar epimerase, putative [Talaromyces stipitatus ATCC 10500]EED13040.1 nucleoside-diphosphate-sugar epimerase, putative [Talaromyces stipitatus ATCC 10500]
MATDKEGKQKEKSQSRTPKSRASDHPIKGRQGSSEDPKISSLSQQSCFTKLVKDLVDPLYQLPRSSTVTGFISREVLEQCLQSTRITSIIALSRRDLATTLTGNPKLKGLIMNNFLSYSLSIMQEVQGAEACILALGKARMLDNETNKTISIEYTLTAARAFNESFSAQKETTNDNNSKLRFPYLSGCGRRTGPDKVSMVHAGLQTEVSESYILRPVMVLSKGTTVRSVVFGMGPSVLVDDFAKVMLKLVLDGSQRLQILENSDINNLTI